MNNQFITLPRYEFEAMERAIEDKIEIMVYLDFINGLKYCNYGNRHVEIEAKDNEELLAKIEMALNETLVAYQRYKEDDIKTLEAIHEIKEKEISKNVNRI